MRTRWSASGIAALVMLAGCASAPATPTEPSPSARPAYHFTYPSVNLNFTARTVEGKQFSGSTLVGKPGLVWFWAPWCPICRSQISGVQEIAQKYQGRVNIVGVGGLDKASSIRRGAEVLPGVTTLVDESGDVWANFKITSQAEFVVLDSTGKVVAEDDNLQAHVQQDVDRLAG
jgi:thiol-disulfide isomerase/thioredoxin